MIDQFKISLVHRGGQKNVFVFFLKMTTYICVDKAKETERCVFYTFELPLSARLDLLRLSHSLDELLNHHPVLVSSIAAGQKTPHTIQVHFCQRIVQNRKATCHAYGHVYFSFWLYVTKYTHLLSIPLYRSLLYSSSLYLGLTSRW